MTLALVLGSAAPVAIAFFLVATTNNDGDNPLDSVPSYTSPVEETLTVPFGADPVRSEYFYRGSVRLVFEGSGQPGGAAFADCFYRFADAAGAPLDVPQLDPALLIIDGQPALDALGLTADPPAYQADHLYSAVLDTGSGWHRLTFNASGSGGSGQITITLVQIE
jgi:hypothetical protein